MHIMYYFSVSTLTYTHDVCVCVCVCVCTPGGTSGKESACP